MMLVYLLAKSGVILCGFKEAFRELLAHYCSSKPVISLPTLHHRPDAPGGAVGSPGSKNGVCMLDLCPKGSVWVLPSTVQRPEFGS